VDIKRNTKEKKRDMRRKVVKGEEKDRIGEI
jgi:hypothetical protein